MIARIYYRDVASLTYIVRAVHEGVASSEATPQP